MRTRAVLAGAILTLVALTGCASSNTEPSAAPSNPATANAEAVPTPTTEPEPTPTETPPGETGGRRGNRTKAIGETAWSSENPDGSNPWFEMQVTGIDVGAKCTEEYAEAPVNGQFMFVNIAVSTSSAWPADLEGVPLDFNPNDFTIVGPDTLTEHDLGTAPTYGCLPHGELFPIAGFGPGENLTGNVVLDSANTTGVLVYHPWWAASGWEWPF